MLPRLRLSLVAALLVGGAPLVSAQPAENVQLLGTADPQSPSWYNDVWGFVDEFGSEYAVLGVETGISILNVTNPASIYETGFIAGSPSIWRDMKTFGDYAYVVTEGSGGGLQVIDLSNPEAPNIATTYTGFDTAHNIFIEGATGRAYVCGHDQGVGGVLVLSLLPGPTPTLLGSWDTTYVHDLYVRNNIGYLAEIYVPGFRIVDFSNPGSISTLAGSVNYPNAFTHNTWTSSDAQILFTTDENRHGHVKLWDVSVLPTVSPLGEFQTQPGTIVHNVIVKDDLAYMSYYEEGMRIIEFSDPTAPVMVGAYDTSNLPNGNYDGDWGIYPFFPSGNILLSDVQAGLFVVAHTNDYGLVQGHVVEDGVGALLNGVELTMLETGKRFTTTGFGSYGMSAAPGGYTLSATKEGFYDQTLAFSIAQGVSTPLEVSLVRLPSAPLSGLVRGGDGLAKLLLPLADARVELVGTGYAATSDAAGAWSIPLVPIGDYGMRVSRNGYGHNELPLAVVNGGSAQGILLSPSSSYLDGSDAGGWTVGEPGDTAVRGLWVRAAPVPSGGGSVQPGEDHSPDSVDNLCFVTGNAAGPSSSIGTEDVDGGFTTLVSPILDLSGLVDPYVAYSRWYVNEAGGAPGSDLFTVEIKGDGPNWTLLEQLGNDATPWQHVSFHIADFINPPSATVQLRFIADDANTGSIVEALVDDLELYDLRDPIIAAPRAPRLDASRIRSVAPNPFNPSTRIQFQLAERGRVRLSIVDLRGRRVATLLDEVREPGVYSTKWTGSDARGRQVSSGVYVALLVAPDGRSVQKLVLTK